MNLVNTIAWLTPLAEGGSMFFNESNSTFGADVDWLFDFIYWLCAICFAGIVFAMVYFVMKYRQRDGHKEQPSPSHSEVLEITWSVIPTLLVGVIFYYGFAGYLDMRKPPEDTYDIQVMGTTGWTWQITYPNGATTTNEVHLPVDRPVRFVIQSSNPGFLHSFFIPAFRTKQDAVPGRYSYTWVHTLKTTGEGIKNEDHTPHDLFCAEYCGLDHSKMRGHVYVHEQADFDAWLVKAADWRQNEAYKGDIALYGEDVYKKKCSSCHTNDGTNPASKPGPTFKGSWGTERTVEVRGGATEKVVMDENYVLESIREPNAKIVAGRKPGMTVFTEALLKQEEVDAIIAYLKTLN